MALDSNAGQTSMNQTVADQGKARPDPMTEAQPTVNAQQEAQKQMVIDERATKRASMRGATNITEPVTRNSSGNMDPTDPVDHLFDGAPVNNTHGRAGYPEHLPSPAGDVATDDDGLARDNRKAVKENLGSKENDAGDLPKSGQASPENKAVLTGAPENR